MKENGKVINVDPQMKISLGELTAIEINMIQQGLNHLPFGQVNSLMQKISSKVSEHLKEPKKKK